MFRMMGLPTCEEVDKFTYDFLDGTLEVRLLKSVERHLRFCKNCQKFIVSYRRIKMNPAKFSVPTLDHELKEKMFEFLKKQSKV